MSYERIHRQILLSVLVLAIVFAGSLTFGILGPATVQARGSDNDDHGPTRVGYAIVTPTSANVSGLVVFETFGEKRGAETSQAGVLPSEMTRSAMMMVSASGRLSRNLGVAIANPGSSDAHVTLTLHREDGSTIGHTSITVPARKQTAQFVTEMFSSQPDVPSDLTGTLQIESDASVSVVGLRFRGSNFSTLPITNLSPAPIPVPDLGTAGNPVGGVNAVILPHFAVGGGWVSEIVISNFSASALTCRVDLYGQDGLPLVADLNGESKSSFTNLTVPAWGVITLSQRNRDGDSDF